jgi:hypothetical protein
MKTLVHFVLADNSVLEYVIETPKDLTNKQMVDKTTELANVLGLKGWVADTRWMPDESKLLSEIPDDLVLDKAENLGLDGLTWGEAKTDLFFKENVLVYHQNWIIRPETGECFARLSNGNLISGK